MTDDLIDRIARTLLYEGYLLYPYRQSAVKNRQRFNFGVLYPTSCCPEGERWQLQTECPVDGINDTTVAISIRFLQLVERPVADGREATRQEALERHVVLEAVTLAEIRQAPRRVQFEMLADVAISGAVEVEAAEACDGVDVLTIRVSNLSKTAERGLDRDRALRHALVSAHVAIEVRDGALVSLLDPPEAIQDIAARCFNSGVWPVLVGEPGSHDRMLASPIILYDYPQIAPESAGDLFDGTEIDEILALRILTLTDEEKREVREGDARARLILERTEDLPPEHWAKLHGAVRGLRKMTGEPS